MTYGDKIDNNIKAADTSNNEKAINNIKDNSTADETDMDSDDILPITKNIYSIDKINKSCCFAWKICKTAAFLVCFCCIEISIITYLLQK